MESDRRCARGGFTCSKSTNILWTQISVSLKISVGGRRAQRAHFPGNPTFKHLNAQGGRADGAVAARYIIVPQAAPISLTRANQGDLRSGGGVHCGARSEEHTSELQSQSNLVCRLLLEKKKKTE